MTQENLKLIDETVALIKAKNNDESTFEKRVLQKFEFELFLSLEIVRYELQNINRLTDITADAISILFVFRCFEYYHRDFPEVYNATSLLFQSLKNYNEKLRKNTLESKVNAESKTWIKYFNHAISNLLSEQRIET